VVFRSLAFVDGRGIGGHQHVELAKPVGHSSAIETGSELAGCGSCRIVGWSMATTPATQLVLDALNVALGRRA